jgi:DNA-binding PucR family transcriptional regulator
MSLPTPTPWSDPSAKIGPMSGRTPDDAAQLLRLLATDAGSPELRGVAVPGQPLTDALTVREIIDVHKRRESALSALVDIARDLATHSGSDGVLDTIVRRARSLLATDIAYLTLYDPARGDTFIRATSGSISMAFQNLRLPLGAGLGGRVAATYGAYASADYLHDERFAHTGEIDGAVAEEGLVAICGTPLIVGEEFVGVLFASHRSPRTFNADEIALLATLAALAAVSIVQSRAAGRTAAALAELSEVHETVRQYSEGIERAATAHDRFAALVLAGGGVEELCAALVDLLGGWAVAVDTQGHQLGAAGRPGPQPEVTVPIRAADERLGELRLGDLGTPLDDADRRTVERAAMVTALVLLQRRAAADAGQRVRADLVTDLVTGAGALDRRQERSRVLGLDPAGPLCVVAARVPPSAHLRGVIEVAEAALDGPGLVGSHGGDLVVVAGATDPAALAQRLGRRLSALGEVTSGAAGPVRGIAQVEAGYREAVRTMGALIVLGRVGSSATAAALGFAGLVVGTEPDVARFLDDQLGALSGYDSGKGTELIATLRVFFAAGANKRRAAEELHIHPNTLAQRLDRVGQLLGPGWNEPDRALELQLALRLHRLRWPDTDSRS